MKYQTPIMLVLLALIAAVAMEPNLGWDRDQAPALGFSVDRAWNDLRTLAAAPRPIGTPAHARARAYIVQQVAALGLEPTVQHAVAVRESGSAPLRVAVVDNIVARLRGSGDGRAVLLAAHYDSVAISPGAADDGAAVAALIEALRRLKASGPFRNDIVVLFTDGEEPGLMGARAFVASHPWAKDVRFVVNLEARGAAGPAVMFETSPGTGGLMHVLGSAAPRPLAPGFAEDVYRLLPNDTDFSIFKQLRQPGFNFAFIERPLEYHAALDSLEHLDARSLRHEGVQALALGRHFGNADLDRLPSGVVTHFNLPAIGLVVHPRWLTALIGGLVVALALASVIVAIRRRRTGRMRAGLTLALLPLNVLLATLVVWATSRLMPGIFGLHDDPWSRIACALLAASGPLALSSVWMTRAGRPNVALATTIWWGALTAVALYMLPAASYLLAWPALAAVPGLAALTRASSAEPPSPRTLGILLLSIVPALLLWIPAGALTAGAIGGGVTLGVMTALLVSLVSPQLLSLLVRPRLLAVAPILTASAAVGCIVADHAGRPRSVSPPRATSLFYALDPSRDRALWVTFDRTPDSTMAGIFQSQMRREPVPDFLDGSTAPRLVADAPVIPLQPPTVTLVDDQRTDAQRCLRLRLASPRGGEVLRAELRASTPIQLRAIGGKALSARTRAATRQAILLYAVPRDGIDLDIAVTGDAPIEVTLVDWEYGLPAIPGRDGPLRPSGTIPARFVPTDLSMVRHAQTID